MRVYTVTLNTAVDVVVPEKDYLESGLKKAERIPAGKGINVSRALKSAGIKSTALALVGEEDLALFNTLDSDEIKTVFIPVTGKTRSNITLTYCEDGLEHHERTQGYLADEKHVNELKKYLIENVEEGDWVIFSGSLPGGIKVDTYKDLIELCGKLGAFTALDSSNTALAMGLSAGPYAIKPNREELEEIIGSKMPENEEILSVFRKIYKKYGVKMILTTLSEYGGILYMSERDEIYRMDAFAPKDAVVSSVGCGDSALAGLISGLLNYLSYEECLKESMLFANANLYTLVPGELKWRTE